MLRSVFVARGSSLCDETANPCLSGFLSLVAQERLQFAKQSMERFGFAGATTFVQGANKDVPAWGSF